MKVKQLKEIINRIDESEDEKEVFASPMVELPMFKNDLTGEEITLVPSLLHRYKVTTVVSSGAVGDYGVYNLQLVFGFDAGENYGVRSDREAAPEDFIN